MDPTPRFFFLLLLLGSGFASSISYDFERCENVVKSWAASSHQDNIGADTHTLRDLLFFLHIPRTGGRTYFHCFLKKLYSASEECPRSYDKLHFDPSKPRCRLLTTHDDYSLMSKLPEERTSVVTILRNPIDRIFSAYEFSIEVAARFLVHPNLTSATQMSKRLVSRTKANGVSTLDIWPWKYLVPWMREDLFRRRAARRLNGIDSTESTDPYDMEDFAMPLHKYLNEPTAHDIIHNGATFQIAGLTNNSYLAESHEVRHCVQKYKTLGEYVLNVAKKRLDSMLYVGLTEDHKESAKMFANLVGVQVISQSTASNSTVDYVTSDQELAAANKTAEENSSFSDTEPDSGDHQSGTSGQKLNLTASREKKKDKSEKMTVENLVESYQRCVSALRKTQAGRRSMSLLRISPVNFTKEARLQIPDQVLEQMKSLNNLDFKLYKYAQDIFAKQSKHVTERAFLGGTHVTESVFLGDTHVKESLVAKEKSFIHMEGIKLWNVVSLIVIVALLCFLFIAANTRRNKSKIKI